MSRGLDELFLFFMGKWEQSWRMLCPEVTSISVFLPFTATVIRASLEINLLKIELLNIVGHKSYLVWHGDSGIASNFFGSRRLGTP